MKGLIKEKQIENHILAWLKFKGIFTFKIKSMGTFDEKLGRFRAPSPWYRKGVADILGIYKGKFIAIEVKSAKGRLSPFQEIFLKDVTNEGGIAILARSVEDLEAQMKIIDVKLFDKGEV